MQRERQFRHFGPLPPRSAKASTSELRHSAGNLFVLPTWSGERNPGKGRVWAF